MLSPGAPQWNVRRPRAALPTSISTWVDSGALRGILRVTSTVALSASLVTATPPNSTTGNIEYKIKNKFNKFEETVSYLSRIEGYRFPESVIVSLRRDTELRSKRKRYLDAGIFWLKEGNTFLIVVTDYSLKKFSNRTLQFLAAHEVCHGIIHNTRIKNGEIVDIGQDDLDADHCAYELLNRHQSKVKAIWR